MAISKIENNSLASGVPSTAKLPAGTVLQVVSANYASDNNTTSTSYISTGLTASITPSSSTSKVLVLFNIPVGKSGSAGVNMQLWRGAGSIYQIMTNGGYDSTSNNTNGYMISECYLDSPATTSSTTYTIYFAANTAGQSAKTFWNTALGTITLMEIAA